eukprot:scaffold1572_cov329-Prasinococcus_capsulatus_cf.AAC.8
MAIAGICARGEHTTERSRHQSRTALSARTPQAKACAARYLLAVDDEPGAAEVLEERRVEFLARKG